MLKQVQHDSDYHTTSLIQSNSLPKAHLACLIPKKFYLSNMKGKFFFSSALIFIACSGMSQSVTPEVIAASGDFSSGSTATLSWTLGEIMTETFSNGTNFLTQGFQQPFTQNSTGIFVATNKTASVFPNPAHEQLFIQLPPSKESYYVSISDISGREIENKKLNCSFIPQSLDLGALPPGVYMITLHSPELSAPSVFKIIKQ
jgi:hypothetical protein